MKIFKNILINAFGIQDSGGIRVLEKLLIECQHSVGYKYTIICNNNLQLRNLNNLYKKNDIFNFIMINNKGFLHRLIFENIQFYNIIKKENIDLIYNFSGTAQPFLNTPQLIKIQNLLFYTKSLDKIYNEKSSFIIWLKQIYFKRVVFQFMSNHSYFLEVQASHVEKYMSDFIDTKEKTFFLKSDISVEQNEFLLPQNYDFTKKVKFLYIVGPHFEYIHKNFIDFTNAMLLLLEEQIDFEINITLSSEQLNNSTLWDKRLNDRTNFLGYISNQDDMDKLFCDNTILISTSIIETIGLHVIEAIKKGVVPIVPDEEYSQSVYGSKILSYKLFNAKSLLNSILSIIQNKINTNNYIQRLQNDLIKSENSKYNNIVNIFQKVIDVQK
jgi:glycosyltransferase involved in cell wall biosynthesis